MRQESRVQLQPPPASLTGCGAGPLRPERQLSSAARGSAGRNASLAAGRAEGILSSEALCVASEQLPPAPGSRRHYPGEMGLQLTRHRGWWPVPREGSALCSRRHSSPLPGPELGSPRFKWLRAPAVSEPCQGPSFPVALWGGPGGATDEWPGVGARGRAAGGRQPESSVSRLQKQLRSF